MSVAGYFWSFMWILLFSCGFLGFFILKWTKLQTKSWASGWRSQRQEERRGRRGVVKKGKMCMKWPNVRIIFNSLSLLLNDMWMKRKKRGFLMVFLLYVMVECMHDKHQWVHIQRFYCMWYNHWPFVKKNEKTYSESINQMMRVWKASTDWRNRGKQANDLAVRRGMNKPKTIRKVTLTNEKAKECVK